MGSALVLQCGGPTAVINASLAAVIAAWQSHGKRAIWGGRHGLQSLVRGDFVELTATPAPDLARLRVQAGAALGSGRHRLAESDGATALDHLRQHAIETLFLIGGNGTMAAAQRLAAMAGGGLQVIGIPKTIDNDVAGTEVAPGYLSAAHFAAQMVRGVGLDLRAMANFDDVAVVEIMGRHAGWLAAATALARHDAARAPHIILLPEAAVDTEALLQRIAAIHARHGICLIAAAEGARNAEGAYLAELHHAAGTDASGQALLSLSGGVASWLAAQVRARLGLRCRQIRPDTLFRSQPAGGTTTDRELAALVGAHAVRAARAGETLVMAGLLLEPAGWRAQSVPFGAVVGKAHHLPAAMIADSGMDVAPAFVQWAQPLLPFDAQPPVLWA